MCSGIASGAMKRLTVVPATGEEDCVDASSTDQGATADVVCCADPLPLPAEGTTPPYRDLQAAATRDLAY